MNKIINLLIEKKYIFNFFEQVYLFGSSLSVKDPNDIDILLVYDECKLKNVNFEKVKMKKILSDSLKGLEIDLTTLNQFEFIETGFLERVCYKKIKG